eukprot:Opistho-1_new@99085
MRQFAAAVAVVAACVLCVSVGSAKAAASDALEDDGDYLFPYPPGQFGPRPEHHAARRASVFRDAPSFEVFQSSRADPPTMPVVDYIVQPIQGYMLRLGHVTFTDNPLRMFSIYEPPGGCPVIPPASSSSLAAHSVTKPASISLAPSSAAVGASSAAAVAGSQSASAATSQASPLPQPPPSASDSEVLVSGTPDRQRRAARTATDTRERPSVTAHAKGCLVAANGGFFNTANGACYGNVVSDGRVVQTSPWHNANFGIRRDGSFVTGYIDEAMVRDPANPFVQLVAGVIWLVRNGTNFVQQSAEVEDLTHQETGQAFVTVRSARSAIGHDGKGRLVTAQVDGKTSVSGIALSDFAELLISKGVVNAINLDGGGSAVAIVNGTIANYPSDGPPLASQERPVTTVVCVHPPVCDPPCANNGTCSWGKCVCAAGFEGSTCAAAVDACAAGENAQQCPATFKCVSTSPGQRACVCSDGYEAVGVGMNATCRPVNVCADPANSGLCGANAVCVFAGPAAHTCACNAGFAKNASGACVDVDECALPTRGGCALRATCHNYPGGWLCVCDAGFAGNGTLCVVVSLVQSLSGCTGAVIGAAFASLLALVFGIVAAVLGYERLRLHRMGRLRPSPENAAFLQDEGLAQGSDDDDAYEMSLRPMPEGKSGRSLSRTVSLNSESAFVGGKKIPL